MRKKYLKPEVESESHVEQTSLACNLTEEPPYGWGEGCDANPTEYSKGGAWMASAGPWSACGAIVFDWDEACGPRDEGVTLS